MANTEFDLCVIGGGAGGLVVAAGAASLGAKVALVEKHRLGGDCLWSGCVPSKTLLHIAKVAHTMRHAQRYGLPGHDSTPDMRDVMQRVHAVIDTIAVNDSPERFRSMGIDVIFGAGRFRNSNNFVVNRNITAKHFVLATGSRPAVPSISGLDAVDYLTNESIFDLREPVACLIVLGGGPVGVELAQAFARLGSSVHMIERGPQLLPAEDPDVAIVVEQRLRAEGIQLHLTSEVLRVENAGPIRVFLKTGSGNETIRGTHLLVATGRLANTEELGLDVAGVKLDARGYILTDDRLRTSAKHIYACGDVTGRHLFTHMAEHHAGVVLRNTLFRLRAKVERRVIPWCTYCDPEVARVGLSEKDAKERGIAYDVFNFSFHDIDRAQAEDEKEGYAKLLTDRRGSLLGATLVGPRAGELIHEYVLALSKRLKADDVSKAIHIYPTLAQINRRVADQRLKARLTPGAKKWIKRIFRLRGA